MSRVISRLLEIVKSIKPKNGWFVGLVIAIGGLIISTIIQLLVENGFALPWQLMNDKYIAVVITENKDATFTIPEEFRSGFGDVETFKSTYTDQNISFRKEDDLLSVQHAKIIADKLINDDRCLLIIGNSTSQLTEVTLNAILSSKKTRPAFMLPIATADNIIDKAKDQGYKAVLRMMPNNDKQANTIKGFIFKEFPKNPKVMILCDEENITYSYNLSQKIADKVLRSNGKIVLKKNYGNTNSFMSDYDFLKQYKNVPDVIVFVGISTNGTLFSEQLDVLNIDIPVIFTDGCTVNNLMDRSRRNPKRYFISAVKNRGNAQVAPTYEPVGEDARELAIGIIKKIKGKLTRESVAEYIKLNRGEISLDHGNAGAYAFDESGENKGMSWKVYAYIDNALRVVYE